MLNKSINFFLILLIPNSLAVVYIQLKFSLYIDIYSFALKLLIMTYISQVLFIFIVLTINDTNFTDNLHWLISKKHSNIQLDNSQRCLFFVFPREPAQIFINIQYITSKKSQKK